MNPIYLKESNLKQVIALTEPGNPKALQGTKLEALYHLIGKKGERIESEDQADKLQGLSCVFLPDNHYFAMKYTPFFKTSFYPCKIEAYLLKETEL